jgi:hypothetical protein
MVKCSATTLFCSHKSLKHNNNLFQTVKLDFKKSQKQAFALPKYFFNNPVRVYPERIYSDQPVILLLAN